MSSKLTVVREFESLYGKKAYSIYFCCCCCLLLWSINISVAETATGLSKKNVSDESPRLAGEGLLNPIGDI